MNASTFMCADIVSSRDLQQRLGTFAYGRLQGDYRRLARVVSVRNGGSLMGSDGDAVYCWFPSAAGALRAAYGLRDAMASGTAHRAPAGLRIGLDCGPGTYRGAIRTGREFAALGARLLLSRFVPVQSWSGHRLSQGAMALVPLWSAMHLCQAASPGEIRLSEAVAEALRSRGEAVGAAGADCPVVERVSAPDSPPAALAVAGPVRRL